jgi:hypothetical protein
LHSHDFTQSPLQLVAIDRAVAMSGNDDANPWMPERGSEVADVEVPSPNSLPPSNDGFQVGLSRQPKLALETRAVAAIGARERIRRLRTCSADGPSGPCGPSCDGG